MDQFSNGFNIVGTLVKLNPVLRGLSAGQPYLLRSYLLKMFEKVMFGSSSQHIVCNNCLGK